MTPQEPHDCKQEEAARIKALRNKRTSTEQTSKSKGIASDGIYKMQKSL